MVNTGSLEKVQATSADQPTAGNSATSAPPARRSTKNVPLGDRLEILQSVLADLGRYDGIGVTAAKIRGDEVAIIISGIDLINGKLIAINGNE